MTRSSFALIFVVMTLTACSEQTPPAPAPAAGPCLSCLDIQALPPQTFPGPTFSLAGLTFTNPTSGGIPTPIQIVDRSEAADGNPEMNVGFSDMTGGRTPLTVTFPAATFPNGVCGVSVDVQHWARPLTIEALDGTGRVVATATQAAQRRRVKLVLNAAGIRTLRVNAVEAHIYGLCWSNG